MLSKTLNKKINAQINAEIYSSYLYYAMSAYLEDKDLPGFANWMHVQALEELVHADKLFKFVNERGGRVVLQAVEAPPSTWDSPLAAFEAALGHEQKISGLINGLVDLALKEKDHMTYNFLQWFVAEQVEEEANAGLNVKKLKLVGADKGGSGLFLLDRELATRVFVPPAATAP